MPLLSITATFTPATENICKVQLSGGSIPAARMRLKQYAVHCEKDGTGKTPSYFLVDLDGILGNTQVHNALPLRGLTGDVYEQNSYLHLPLTESVTVQQTSIGVEVVKHIPRQLDVKVFKYEDTAGANFHQVVPFPTATPSNSVSVREVQLWFEYFSPNLF